jgi:leucyl-tRNA synthetase
MKADQYVCVMFPYPSGAGLHLGHYYNYAVIDSYSRWQRHRGQSVFQPFGYDAFGLPAENYAKSVGRDPRDVTYENIENFRQQMDRMRTQFDERLVTSDPEYTRWTQWLFRLMQERGLAYKAWADVNWCPSCETVLANEQAKSGTCDRCDTAVEQKNMHQWFFKITEYKDRLLANLDHIDYPKGTIKMQREWIANLRDWCVSRQRKWGCPIPVDGETDTLDTFVDSSFYFLRYLTESRDEFLPREDYQQVDLYVGGPEHACMHLVFARFVHMVLFDAGIVPVEEPFKKVIHQGMITAGGAKMSKSKGNAINPDGYDPAELRFHLMFLGHYFDGGDWSDDHIKGTQRFFKRMRAWLDDVGDDEIDLSAFEEQIDRYVAAFKFNKVVSSFMEMFNKNKSRKVNAETANRVAGMLDVFAPGWRN